MGEQQPKTTIITFEETAHKREVFQNIGRVKNYVNKDKHKLGFKDYVSASELERKKGEGHYR